MEGAMPSATFAAAARRAVTTVSRRASLAALAAAALGGAASPVPVEAKKRCSKKCDQRCAAQSGPCNIAVTDVCNGSSNPDQCIGRCSLCCSRLRNCDPLEVADSATCLMGCVAA
jgi:hypothetical protein